MGIYLSQPTLENRRHVLYLIDHAKEAGINTFVIDFSHMSPAYRHNIRLVKSSGLRYVARIVMFPGGASPRILNNQRYLEKNFHTILQAVALGADAIQLDYIRYRKSQPKSHRNAEQIASIIRQVSTMLQKRETNIQIDIFGIASFGESLAIGQNARLFAPLVDAICPMVYPSHFEPFSYHARRPYQTVYRSLMALHQQLKAFPHVKIYAYIELFNYRYPLNRRNRVRYIVDQMRAVHDAHIDGWYFWSAHNCYDLLFKILNAYQHSNDHL